MACENLKISFIGAGRMGEAIIRGLIRSGADPAKLRAADADQDRLAGVAAKHGIGRAESNAAAVDGADVVVIAVKPKDVPAALADIKEAIRPETLVISIAAGVNLKILASGLQEDARIVRVMPNAPAEKGAGFTAIAGRGSATGEDIKIAEELFSAVGLTVIVDESRMNAVTAISGSGPAYFYLFVKALSDAGESLGLDERTAYALAHETMFGSSRVLKYTKKPPEELIDAVKSPGGTTAAALKVMEDRGFESIINDAVKAAADRGAEIEREIEGTERTD
jgi:pyrroline-5-carboxylate reductase